MRIKRLLEISNEKQLDIKVKKCESMIEDLFYKGKGNTASRMVTEDKFSVTSSKVMDNDFLRLAASYSSINLKGETDEPVTTDIKRLIRCPGSLHGKTGLNVLEIDKHEIDQFDPLDDAVVLPSGPVNIEVNAPFEMKMKGKDWDLEEGPAEVPKYLAYFMVAKRLALIS
jgi:DNA primase small subunit